jgi:hypothetical protein
VDFIWLQVQLVPNAIQIADQILVQLKQRQVV